MDVLKQKGKHNKQIKERLLKRIDFEDGEINRFGKLHIKQKNYGKLLLNGIDPLTNREVKRLKKNLKIEYRGVKRHQKHLTRKEIEEILLEDIENNLELDTFDVE